MIFHRSSVFSKLTTGRTAHAPARGGPTAHAWVFPEGGAHGACVAPGSDCACVGQDRSAHAKPGIKLRMRRGRIDLYMRGAGIKLRMRTTGS